MWNSPRKSNRLADTGVEQAVCHTPTTKSPHAPESEHSPAGVRKKSPLFLRRMGKCTQGAKVKVKAEATPGLYSNTGLAAATGAWAGRQRLAPSSCRVQACALQRRLPWNRGPPGHTLLLPRAPCSVHTASSAGHGKSCGQAPLVAAGEPTRPEYLGREEVLAQPFTELIHLQPDCSHTGLSLLTN